MSEIDDRCRAALSTMAEWNWLRCDPDGVPFETGMALSYVVSRLAMEGISNPAWAVLHLLAGGQLSSRGDYYWSKYESGHVFQLEGRQEALKPSRWRAFLDTMRETKRSLMAKEPFDLRVDLPKLKKKQCFKFEWDFHNSGFRTAFRSSNDTYVPGYTEELYSARAIEIWPSDLDLDGALAGTDAQPATGARSGRPPAKWWPDFAEELAVYIHEDGLPDGEGHEGQSIVIDAIFARLAEQGKAEPGRGTVQPVVNAVLRRTRSAGN